MELLVWHAALGCDDEQASDAELRARVLFSYATGAPAGESESEQQLRALRLAQALLAFAQRLATSASSESSEPAWLSVTLSRRRFFLQEVEPQIFMALGVQQAAELREHRFVYRAVMRDLYGMFRLFHGSIDSNLKLIPANAAAEETEEASRFADGMELLLAIQAARKRIRKIDIALEQCEDEDEDKQKDSSARRALESERASAQSELDALLQTSPATRLERRFRSFFPTLLHALDASHASSLHELIGMGQLAVDQSTFLSLQSFLNAFRLDLADTARSSALFFKGNLLWSSMDARTLQLLYRFLRLREEHGMEAEVAPPAVPSPDPHSSSQSSRESVWMVEKYRDTFLPVWSSKTSYAECAVVNHARRHPRKTVRSLHKQSPAPLSTVVTDANGPPHFSASSKSSRDGADESADPLALPRTLSRSELKARLKSVLYRNTGLLMKNGYFAKTFELPIRSRGRGKFSESQAVDFIWKPRIFPVSERGAAGIDRDEPQDQQSHYVVAWHEADLTMLVLVKDSAGEPDRETAGDTKAGDDDDAAAQVLETLRRVEDAMDRLKFHELAKLVASQSSRSSGNTGGGGSRPSSSSAAAPFVYLNRANMTFRALQIPRLIRSKDATDLFPLPLRLLANYLPQQTLELLNELHGELHKCGRGETRDVCVKTLHDGWVLGKKAEMTQREFYAFFDTKVPSVVDLSDALEDLLQDQLGDVFF